MRHDKANPYAKHDDNRSEETTLAQANKDVAEAGAKIVTYPFQPTHYQERIKG